eukprot:6100726-Ditylum_brightwellii.AAC.1
MATSNVLVNCLATVNSFNLKYKGQGFPLAEREDRDLIPFFWAASKGNIPQVAFVDSSDAFV